MNLEEIRKLSDEALHLELHLLVNPCDLAQATGLRAWLANGIEMPSFYCTDLNEIAAVEKLAVNKVWYDGYGKFLNAVADVKRSNKNACLAIGATFTARQRAEACLLALQ